MAGNGLNVKDVNEIRRLWQLGFSNRKIARATGIHRNTVNKFVDSFKNKTDCTESKASVADTSWCANVDWESIRVEYLKGVSLNVIHEELVERNQVQVQYAGFWKQVKKRISLSEATMVRVFKPGANIEIDYADGIDLLDPISGEVLKTQLFVGVLCHSRFAFAEFTLSQKSADFLQSHVNMFNYFGGTTQVVSPDNLKSAVTKVHRYDPVINQAYARLASHYDVAVVPARVRTPKDKAIVERTIQIFQRYFFMKVRHRTFTSLVELNQCLREHLVVFNQKKHRIFKQTRQEMYLAEKLHLRPLPTDTYKVATYSRAKLSRDCHLIFDDNFYSAPHELRGKDLDIWSTANIVEIYNEGERVALHSRRKGHWLYNTNTDHYPPAQAAFAEQDLQKVINKAAVIGSETSALIKGQLTGAYPLRFLRRCQGIIALSWKYTPALLEAACKDANLFNNNSIRFIERVIKTRKGVANKSENEIKERAFNPYLRGINNIH